MHPVVILIPVAVLVLGPKLWAARVLKQHNQKVEFAATAGAYARVWLDRNQLHAVQVEVTDLGDHYDPEAKAIRLSRDKHARSTLTAVTTAAHEVSHALQDAENYGPFLWRNRLAKLAMGAGQVGTVILISVPAAALLGRRPIPPVLVGTTLFAMLGTGMVAQLTALLSELDASFKRALPLLQEVCVSANQIDQAQRILLACSLTYAASSLLSVLQFWPWLGRAVPLSVTLRQSGTRPPSGVRERPRGVRTVPQQRPEQNLRPSAYQPIDHSDGLVRKLGKPMIRLWFRVAKALA